MSDIDEPLFLALAMGATVIAVGALLWWVFAGRP
jgi:hypothetical protein